MLAVTYDMLAVMEEPYLIIRGTGIKPFMDHSWKKES